MSIDTPTMTWYGDIWHRAVWLLLIDESLAMNHRQHTPTYAYYVTGTINVAHKLQTPARRLHHPYHQHWSYYTYSLHSTTTLSRLHNKLHPLPIPLRLPYITTQLIGWPYSTHDYTSTPLQPTEFPHHPTDGRQMCRLLIHGWPQWSSIGQASDWPSLPGGECGDIVWIE